MPTGAGGSGTAADAKVQVDESEAGLIIHADLKAEAADVVKAARASVKQAQADLRAAEHALTEAERREKEL